MKSSLPKFPYIDISFDLLDHVLLLKNDLSQVCPSCLISTSCRILLLNANDIISDFTFPFLLFHLLILKVFTLSNHWYCKNVYYLKCNFPMNQHARLIAGLPQFPRGLGGFTCILLWVQFYTYIISCR